MIATQAGLVVGFVVYFYYIWLHAYDMFWDGVKEL